jgi:alkylation response protein AidB-like acyl-CoA dehydrogenase
LSFILVVAYLPFSPPDGPIQQIQQRFLLLRRQTGQKALCFAPTEPVGSATQSLPLRGEEEADGAAILGIR